MYAFRLKDQPSARLKFGNCEVGYRTSVEDNKSGRMVSASKPTQALTQQGQACGTKWNGAFKPHNESF